jgi:hypothetical protein
MHPLDKDDLDVMSEGGYKLVSRLDGKGMFIQQKNIK